MVKYVAVPLSNLYFLNEIRDCLSPTVSQLPMLHTWSPGVEEQFYIVFPLLLMVLYRFVGKPKVRLVVIAVLFVISLGRPAPQCPAIRRRRSFCCRIAHGK
jgi:peptidoglycan/LPS O-acetylase OafA/YrhL